MGEQVESWSVPRSVHDEVVAERNRRRDGILALAAELDELGEREMAEVADRLRALVSEDADG